VLSPLIPDIRHPKRIIAIKICEADLLTKHLMVLPYREGIVIDGTSRQLSIVEMIAKLGEVIRSG